MGRSIVRVSCRPLSPRALSSLVLIAHVPIVFLPSMSLADTLLVPRLCLVYLATDLHKVCLTLVPLVRIVHVSAMGRQAVAEPNA